MVISEMDDEPQQRNLFETPEASEPSKASPSPRFETAEEVDNVSQSANESSEEIDPANFQEAMDQLQEAAKQLESGELPLEEAMERYREGQQLIKFCEERLEEAELLVEEIDDTGESSSIQRKEEPTE